MAFSDRELFARLIMCEAGGEGNDGMAAVAVVVMNRVNINYGEFARVSQGGNLRNILTQPGQFTCMMEVVDGQYNAQNVYNMNPTDIHYAIADWAMGGGGMQGVDNSLFFYNPYSPQCRTYFPPGGAGVFHNRIGAHCFYVPTPAYANT